MNNNPSPDSVPARIITFIATGLLILSSPWTLQAFVPEPYFLRTPEQLRVMSTPNGFGQIERSLLPFYSVVGGELLALLLVAAVAWRSGSVAVSLAYLLAVIAMAGVTLWRLSEAIQWFN